MVQPGGALQRARRKVVRSQPNKTCTHVQTHPFQVKAKPVLKDCDCMRGFEALGIVEPEPVIRSWDQRLCRQYAQPSAAKTLVKF